MTTESWNLFVGLISNFFASDYCKLNPLFSTEKRPFPEPDLDKNCVQISDPVPFHEILIKIYFVLK